jgi:hypothetical protein
MNATHTLTDTDGRTIRTCSTLARARAFARVYAERGRTVDVNDAHGNRVETWTPDFTADGAAKRKGPREW